ncbi:MerR family transcriptional regulator [Nocardia mexicana]|uniref:DNA-binding transcriptional MerR regulator n=1 Tax=Nocardia mexicana TaxID=279262 RepID=A0A370GLD8_9NOCA|nr:MerR family transcriptional regulator [Nocardia mexicana]RDI44467.1 DNA-binding transcriptional MerR regulator [Nocardia mexicana]
MRISELAEHSGVPATTLRYYEGAGLVPAERTEAGYRVYREDSVRRLAVIGAAKDLGLPLTDIAEVLAVWDGGACVEVKSELRPRVAASLERVEGRLAELADFAGGVRSALRRLDALPDRDGPCDDECGLGAGGPVAAGETWRSAPLACSLDNDAAADRTEQWHRAIEGAERAPIPNGLRLTVAADRASSLAALAAAEQRCCPFFGFALHFDGPLVHLDIRAPEAAATMLAEIFGAAP